MRKRLGYGEKVTAVFMAILLFSIPILAQESQTQQATREAQVQAASDVNSTTWFIIGCLLGAIGWLISFLVEPNPPAAQLLGKSPDYVAVYTDAYKRKAKSIQQNKALIGCLVGTGVSVAAYVILFAIAAEETTTGYYYY